MCFFFPFCHFFFHNIHWCVFCYWHPKGGRAWCRGQSVHKCSISIQEAQLLLETFLHCFAIKAVLDKQTNNSLISEAVKMKTDKRVRGVGVGGVFKTNRRSSDKWEKWGTARRCERDGGRWMNPIIPLFSFTPVQPLCQSGEQNGRENNRNVWNDGGRSLNGPAFLTAADCGEIKPLQCPPPLSQAPPPSQTPPLPPPAPAPLAVMITISARVKVLAGERLHAHSIWFTQTCRRDH